VGGHMELFGEGPSRVVACVAPDVERAVAARAAEAGVATRRLGLAGGDRLVVEGLLDVSLADATARYRGLLTAMMAATALQEG
jgi:hypothetical protein